jgi:hypothetical protein
VKVTKLRIDGQFFHIEPTQDTDLLRLDVMAASIKTSYVHFAAVGHGDVSVLMAPGMSARFEVREVDDAELDEFEEHPPAVDFDTWHGLDT